MKRIILLLFVLTTIASTSCKKNLDYQDPSDKSIDQEIVSLNKQFKDLLERVNPTIRKTPITPKEMENIDDFESTVYSFVRKHTGNSRKTRSTEDFHPEEYLDNPEKLLVDIKERGVTEEFYTILNKILVDNSSQIISEGSIMNNQLLAHDEKLTILLVNSLLSSTQSSGADSTQTRAISCAEQREKDRSRCDRNAAISLVSSLILIPVSGGASAAVGVSASIAYHVACYKDADQDYLDCIK